MGFYRDIRAMLRWVNRTERAAFRAEARMVGKFTPEGQKRYRRWRRLFFWAALNKKVTGYW
jgi:hypothetical protein